MKLRLFMLLTVAFALFTTGAFAADISGKWTAETKGRDGETRTQTFDLKQDGGKLTGTVSSPMGDSQISDGKVDGDNVSFVVKVDRNGTEMTLPYTGKVSGNEIQFKVESPRGTREMTAKKSTT